MQLELSFVFPTSEVRTVVVVLTFGSNLGAAKTTSSATEALQTSRFSAVALLNWTWNLGEQGMCFDG